jgi:outer membrane receptor protein involved in Fe transport
MSFSRHKKSVHFAAEIKKYYPRIKGVFMKYIRVLASALAVMSAANLSAEEAVFYVVEEGKPLSDVAVIVDGNKKLVQKNGFTEFDVDVGEHEVQLTQLGEIIGDFSFEIMPAQTAEIKVEMIGGEAMPSINVFSENNPDLVAKGKITGVLSSAETGGVVDGARIAIEGTEYAVMSDNDGYFEIDLPRGTYNLTISHPNYGKKNSNNIRVFANAALELNFDMSMSGTGVIEELVATGSYLPATDIAQKRDASSILDSIDSEQFSKMGDSDAASALKRVSGVSLIGGQYAVVRGLNGRYISASLNGGVIPSTNPLTRDVALDLFPAGVLQGIEINKGFTPNLPGDSTGGAINMVTKGIPESRIAKLYIGSGFRAGVTGKDVISYEGGDFDYLGVDDGTREMPGLLNAFTQYGQADFDVCNDASGCVSRPFAASLANSLENNYNVETKKAAPDFDIGLSYGDLVEKDFGRIGYYGDVSYKSEWEGRQDAEIHDDEGGNYSYERSRRNIDFNFYGVLGYQDSEGNLELLSKTIILRKTDDTTKQLQGVDEEGTQIEDITLQWVERSYIGQTFSGEHLFDNQTHEVDWRFTSGMSMLYEPDRRTYQYRNNKIFPSTLERRFTDQTEDSTDFAVDYIFNWQMNDAVTGKLMLGIEDVEKQRDVKLARFGISQAALVSTEGMDLESLLTPENFLNGDFTLRVNTAATDSYKAEDNMFSYYLNNEVDINNEWIVTVGARFEDAEQSLFYVNSPNSNDSYKTDEILPAFGLTWKVTDQWQLRASYSETVSRPGLTERSLSSQYDPETDEQVFGNNKLILSNINNFDFRAEYYFDDIDSVSLGMFVKEIDNPIEKTVPDASGSAADGYTFVNQDKATVSGLEFDIRKTVHAHGDFTGYISSNVSLIDSEVKLAGRSIPLEGGITSRELQGQSDVLVNFQYGLEHLPTLQTITFLLNYFDDRIHKVGRAGRNEIEEGRPTIDVVYKYEMTPELTFGAKIQNLFDQKVKYSINDNISEVYSEGTYFKVNMDYNF